MSEYDKTMTSFVPPESASGADPLIGAVIGGKYKVIDAVARGGMGRIYRAEQRPIGRIVALKALAVSSGAETDPQFKSRFFLEAATLGRLKHPNTVTVFDYGFEAGYGVFYMVMEYVEGRTLSRLIKDEGSLTPERALKIGIEIARSLAEAHELGIIHRDLKPGNVMVGVNAEGEFVKVLDFGIAKVLQEEVEHHTMADQLIGSPRYMAPEQIRTGPIEPRTDQYSLGVMLFEMLAGAPPFTGDTSVRILVAHLQEPVPRLLTPRGPISPEVDALVRRCLEKEADRRFRDMRELRATMQAALDRLLGVTTQASIDAAVGRRTLLPKQELEPDSQSTLPRPPEPETPPTTKRSFAVLFAGVLALAVLVGAGAMAVVIGLGDEAAPVADISPPELAPAAPTMRTLEIRSDPPGAEVWEGETSLGVTPLITPLDPAFSSTRTFELRLEGHSPARLSQAPTDADAKLSATLEKIAAPPPKKAPPRTTRTDKPPDQGDDAGFRSQR